MKGREARKAKRRTKTPDLVPDGMKYKRLSVAYFIHFCLVSLCVCCESFYSSRFTSEQRRTLQLKLEMRSENAVEFIKLNYNLINFSVSPTSSSSSPLNLIYFPSPCNMLPWTLIPRLQSWSPTGFRRTWRKFNLILLTPKSSLIDNKFVWFSFSICPRFLLRVCSVYTKQSSHTTAGHYFTARNTTGLNVYAQRCFPCNSMLIHFMFRFRKDLF